MTITFFSNFLNIHQSDFCEEIISHIGLKNFHFVASTEMDDDRIKMGWENMNETRPYVIKAYNGGSDLNEAIKLARESDVAILGSSGHFLQNIRLQTDKLTFLYNERLFKKGKKILLNPRIIRSFYLSYTKYRNKKNLYVLCASAYTKDDLKTCYFPSEKCFKWGYFPHIPQLDIQQLFKIKKDRINKTKKISILWASRLIDWKHPEVPIYIASHLKKLGYEFELNMIGDGELYPIVENIIKKEKLQDYVYLHGALNHESTLKFMQESDIFLFTSDRNEGWGAVLNEAMSCGCAMVANRHIGSVPYLIHNKENGLTYENATQAFENVLWLINNPKEREILGVKAYNNIKSVWNIKNATNNLIELISKILQEQKPLISSGPCSKA